MENSEVTIEGENYELVDECIGEEDASNAVKKKSMDNDDNAEKQDTTVTDNSAKDENVKEDEEEVILVDSENNPLPDDSNPQSNIETDTLNTESQDPQQTSAQQTESFDFTADINLDQLDKSKNTTDEDVLVQLDIIENIELNSSDFQAEQETNESVDKNVSASEIEEIDITAETSKDISISPQVSDNNDEDSKQEVIIKEPKAYDWYEKKLSEKETVIRERLSKVARVLGISYPVYENWLKWEEKANGSPLCMLKPARRCCLDKPYTNRWKFICAKRKIQDPTKMNNDTDTDATDNKNAELVWKLKASDACGANINNEFEFPPFVLQAVKIFEDFLQATDQSTPQTAKPENYSDDISMDVEPKNEINNELRQDWLWLLVRCNSMDELMLFATGRNIKRATMDRLKQVFESGPGKDCNVKSLYCKSLNKCNDTVITDTTFLVGSEALDEVVGGLKIQLAPKTNFWSNTAGAENIANAVMELLVPTPKTTVLEIGCGIGIIGLIMASKCQQVIGVDTPSEVEEAEMTCELNNIKNASFIMGTPSEVTTKIIAAVKNRKTSAIINANTNIGRAIEVMTCLKKIPSLKRIVMITTLTKQSVRAILELARPMDSNHGPPFIPILARVVDTLPVGPHFEAVILLQRRTINKLNQQHWFQQILEDNAKGSENRSNQEQTNEQSTNGANKKVFVKGDKTQIKKNFSKLGMKYPPKKSKILAKKTIYTKNPENFTKNIFKGKRSHSPDKGEAPPKKMTKKFNKFGVKPWNSDLPAKKKKEWMTENPQLRVNPLYDKKIRDQPDLRERLSNNRYDTDIAQTVKEHQALLEIAKEKLSGPAPTVDVTTAKQLQSMLNMVLEQTNKLQSQLPRSVWDRIAPPENANSTQRENKQDDPLLKGRYIQERGSQDILITAANQQFLNNEECNTKPSYKKYTNIPPLEPNTIMPVSQPINHGEERPYHVTSARYETNVRQQQTQEPFNRNRWSEIGSMKKPTSPMRRHSSPIKHRMSPPNRLSPKRPLLSPPRRPCSPPRRHFSPTGRPLSPMYRQRSPMTCQISPLKRPLSPPRRGDMFLNRPMSPLRRQISPIRSAMSPPRRQPSPMRRPISPPRRQVPSPNRMMSPSMEEMFLSGKRRLLEKYKISVDCSSSLSRPQSPHRRHTSPQRFTDDWDIPSRGAIEQCNWSRSGERPSEQNIWRNDKALASNSNWDQAACNARQQKSFDQEKWDTKISVRNDAWSNNGNSWNPKQLPTKPLMKETWSSNFDNRWSNVPGSSNENWNIRGKESFTGYKEPWMDNKKQSRWESSNAKDSWKHCDKEDLNDLPEDAKDPWGDDGISDLKERWLKFENAPTSSTWTRENEQQGDAWSRKKDNWLNKGPSFNAKSQWQNNGVQNVGDSRWHPQNNMEKKTPTGSTWKSEYNMGSWQFQNSNFQSQRPFSTSQFKSSY